MVRLKDFFESQTTRLMLTYIAIIMAMTISFSAIIYIASAEQLDRQLPRGMASGSGYYIDEDGQFGPAPRVQAYIEQQIASGKNELFVRLFVLNLVMLVFGAAFSFVLARWTLEPIERNIESQTRFVSDASHELRTPLTAIQATNEVALRRKKLTIKDAREVIQSNIDDVKRLQRMTSMLLELASDDRQTMLGPTHLHDIVSIAITNIAAGAMGRDINIDDKTKNYLVSAESESIAQALTILLDNAVKYSPEGAKVTLSSRKRRSMVEISVRDEGPGIDKSEQKKIFERFYRSDKARTHSESAGYGLGLEIAQKIAKSHGGVIELVSAPGKGSTFSILLHAASPGSGAK